MARRREAQKREITPDPKFNDMLVARFINCILNKGKKGLAETIFYKALENIEAKGKEEPLRVFRKAMKMPLHCWKCGLAEWAVLPIRFRLR